MTNHYELLYLVAASYSEEELNPIKTTIVDLISKYEGKITFEDNFGKKKLAYPVKKNTQGYYLIVEFDIDGEKLKDLNNEIKLTNEILRHVVIARKPGTDPATLSMSEKIITDGPRVRRKVNAPRPTTSKPATTVTSPQATEKKKEETKDDSKVKLDNLDEKLDELLEGDIM